MNGTAERIIYENCTASLDVRGQQGGIVACPYCGTEHVLSKEVRQVTAEYSRKFTVVLFHAMVGPFSDLSDVDTLIVNLSGLTPRPLYPDSIPGKGVEEKIRELVMYAYRNGVLQELVDCALAMRPHMDI